MTNTCPHCGTPIRPGTKFCGSCGNPILDINPSPSETNLPTCPHCGKPVRPDANFCPHCGQAITSTSVSTEDDTITRPIEKTTPKTQQPPPPLESPISPPPPEKSTVGKFWWLILIIIISCLLCLLVTFLANREGLVNIPGISNTDTPTAIIALTATSTQEIIEIETAIPSQTPAATIAPSPTGMPAVILDEKFENGLEDNWLVWGSPPPTIQQGITYYLSLDAKPRAAGITSNTPQSIFNLAPLTTIEFQAVLKDISTTDILSLDWDPLPSIRNGASEPGPLHLDIGDSTVKLTVNDILFCEQRLQENKTHIYRIQIDNEGRISLSMDDLQICAPALIELPGGEGRISISGSGRVDNLLITQAK